MWTLTFVWDFLWNEQKINSAVVVVGVDDERNTTDWFERVKFSWPLSVTSYSEYFNKCQPDPMVVRDAQVHFNQQFYDDITANIFRHIH